MTKNKNHFFRDSRAVFENYKDTYRQEIQNAISFVGQDLDFYTEVKAFRLLDLTRKILGKPSRLNILDVGCGIGITDHYLTPHFKKVHGIDLSSGIVKKAAKLNPKARYQSYRGKKLPYADNSMDITFAICVLHHVEPRGLEHFNQEMIRVTKKGGLIVIFEHNPLNPLTRKAVSNCELDENAHLLRLSEVKKLLVNSGTQMVDRRYILFTPFRGWLFSLFDRCMGWLPLGAQYLVAVRK